MSKVRKIDRFDPHNTEDSADEGIFLLEFEGKQYVLSYEDVEKHLCEYFELREQLRREKKLRKQYEHLDELYGEYRTALALVFDEQKKK